MEEGRAQEDTYLEMRGTRIPQEEGKSKRVDRNHQSGLLGLIELQRTTLL
jgi:hypothetical protein